MIEKKYLHAVFAEKPDIFGSIPEKLFGRKMIEELRSIPNVAIGEIPGHGRFEHLYEVLSLHHPDAFVPTLCYTGSEYGSFEKLYRACVQLKKSIQRDMRIYCIDPVIIGSPAAWRALNGVWMDMLTERFKQNCMCLGCRIYACAMRIPLCRMLDAHAYIVARNGQYEGCCADEHEAVIRYCRLFLSGFGVEVIDKGGRRAEHNVHGKEKMTEDDELPFLHCLFESQNNGMQRKHDHNSVERFFESFAIPAAAHIVGRTLAGGVVDYFRETKKFL